MESQVRSIIKGISYRGLGSLITVIIVFALTGSWPVAGTLGVIEFFAKIFLYYFHERLWNIIKWGKKSDEF